MKFLKSMTSADAETRFMLLILSIYWWRFDPESLSGAFKTLDVLGFPKNKLNSALDYLVNKGYVRAYKLHTLLPKSKRKVITSYFELSPEYRQIWSFEFTRHSKMAEFVLVLTEKPFDGLKSVKKSLVSKEAQLRLVLAVLVLKTDDAGYIFDFDIHNFCELIGMSEKKFQECVRYLKAIGHISIVAKVVRASGLFHELGPVYKVHPDFHHNKKIIKLGLALPSGLFAGFKFLRDADQYLEKQAMMKKLKIPQERREKLTNFLVANAPFEVEQYEVLVGILLSQKLRIYLWSMSMAIIFDVVRSSLLGPKMAINLPQPEFALWLNNQVRAELVAKLASKLQHLSEDLQSGWRYLFNELISELVGRADQLIRQWRLLNADYRHGNLVGYLPDLVMYDSTEQSPAVTTKAKSDDTLNQQSAAEMENKIRGLGYVSFVFDVSVPASKNIQDLFFVSPKIQSTNCRVLSKK